MTVKDILEDFSKKTGEPVGQTGGIPGQIDTEIETLKIKLNRCFVEIILPSVFATERDLHEGGFWNQLNIGQSTSLSSGKPNIKEVTIYFHPERTLGVSSHHNMATAAHKAQFRPTGDMRKIEFSIHFPKTILPMAETESAVHDIDDIHTPVVDLFLERFVKGAVEVYTSDRIFR